MYRTARENCDTEEERRTVKRITPDQLEAWGILSRTNGKWVASNAYALLVGDTAFQIRLKCGLFKGDDKAVFLDRREFSGSVTELIDEKGNRVSSEIDQNDTEVKVKSEEVGPKGAEVGPKSTEVKVKTEEVGPKNTKVGPKPDFEVVMRAYRKDFRMTCASVWECLAADSTLSRRSIAFELKIAESSIQSAMNALQEVGLLKREGYGKGRTWIVKTYVT